MLNTLCITKDNYYTKDNNKKYFECTINSQNAKIYYTNYCMVKKGEKYLAVIDNNKLINNYPLINMFHYSIEDIGDYIFHTLMKIDSITLNCDNSNRAKTANNIKCKIYSYLHNTYNNYVDNYKNFNMYPLSYFTYLSKLASDYIYYNKPILNIGIDDAIWSKFLVIWYSQHNRRILHNYGLFKNQIKNMELDTLYIYYLLTHNPYLIYTASNDLADKIIEMNGLFIPLQDNKLMKIVGAMLCNIYAKYNTGYLCTPTSQLRDYTSYFSIIQDRLPELLLHADNVNNNYYYYLHSSNVMEQTIINKLVQLRQQDKFTYPPICDYELDNDKIMEIFKEDASYICSSASKINITDRQKIILQSEIHKVENNDQYITLNKILNDQPITNKQYKLLQSIDNIKSIIPSQIMSPDQLIAIQGAINNNICIITGPAGSGKSRCIHEILKQINRRRSVIIGTPTGIAASRLRKELNNTGVIIGTLHSLIGFRNSKNITKNILTESGRITAQIKNGKFKHLIIDEAGMVSYDLLYKTLLFFPEIEYITLVGDYNQLQPINSPSLFRQIVLSNTIPVYRLWTNHRCTVENIGNNETLDNYILINASNIIKGERYLHNCDNFQIINSGSIQEIFNISNYLQSQNVPCCDVTVICPLKAPLKNLNTELRNLWNFNNLNNYYIDSWKVKWCVGDRVRMTVNNRDYNVFNGDEGIITFINQKGVYINFLSHGDNATPLFFEFVAGDPNLGKNIIDENEHHIIEDESDENYNNELVTYHLQLSYALTIHSCQGAEYSYIILYLPSSCTCSNTFFNNSMLYTIITRAKKFCFCLGDENEMLNAIMCSDNRDCTHSVKLISNKLPTLEPFISTEPIEIPEGYIPPVEDDEYEDDYYTNDIN